MNFPDERVKYNMSWPDSWTGADMLQKSTGFIRKWFTAENADKCYIDKQWSICSPQAKMWTEESIRGIQILINYSSIYSPQTKRWTEEYIRLMLILIKHWSTNSLQTKRWTEECIRWMFILIKHWSIDSPQTKWRTEKCNGWIRRLMILNTIISPHQLWRTDNITYAGGRALKCNLWEAGK